MQKYYKYHYYNGVFKKEVVEVDDLTMKKMKQFGVLVGCQKCDVNLIEDDDSKAMQMFVEKYQKRVADLEKSFVKAKRELEIIKKIQKGEQ